MSSKGAKTRSFRAKFDPTPFGEAVGARPTDVRGLFREAGGKFVSFHPGKPGKVDVSLVGDGKSRTFGIGEIDKIKEWVASGGTIKKEQNKKALIAAAPELLEALEDCDRAFAGWQVGVPPGRPEDILALIAKVRAAIKKAKGE